MMTFNQWMGTQGKMALVHANCCRIAYGAGQQSRQAEVEELEKEWLEINQALEKSNESGFQVEAENRDLQKRVGWLKGQLERAGYTDNGGELMKPPTGKPPRFDLLDELKNSLSELAQKYRVEAHELSRIRDFEKSQMYSHFANELEHLLKGGA